VTRGESGAVVLRHISGSRFAKVASAHDVDALEAERDRIEWLHGAGVVGPTVLEWRVSEFGVALVTSAVAGITADQLDSTQLRAAWPSIIETLQDLHGVPTTSCPYDRSLETMMIAARANVADDRVRTDFLPEQLHTTPPRVILDGLERELPQRQHEEATSSVVCHGDFCLPNVLVDPHTLEVTGLVDLGRLGRADPYADIALLLANARTVWASEDTARDADEEFARRYDIALDRARLEFYLRLDPLTW
jgi:streptomycin 3"-kinase